MRKLLPFLIFLFLRECFGHGSFAKKPHVIFILIDDLGFDDLGYVNPDVKSPNIDYLAKNALHIDKYYNQPSCTPSRAALMTGRYNIRYGLQSGVIKPDEPEAIPLSETLLPEAFKQCGYQTSMHGKWHLGFYTKYHCPQNRGFDRFFGFYLGSQDYFYHDSGNNCYLYSPCYRGEIEGPPKKMELMEKKIYRPAGFDFREVYSNGTEKIRFDLNGTYSTKAIADDFIAKLDDFDPETPLFEFLSFQEVHGPLQWLPEFSTLFKETPWTHYRKMLSRKIAVVDHFIGEIVKALKEKGFWKDTLLIITSDNGGQTREGASNWPLRGKKGNIFEGGIRSRAFVHSPKLPESLKGKSFPYVMHVTDWLPTLLRSAGCEVPPETLPLDGVAQDLFHLRPVPKRSHLLNFMDPLKRAKRELDSREFQVLSNRTFDVTVKAAIRSENWKLITGRPCHWGCSFSQKKNLKYEPDKVALEDVEEDKLVRLYAITEDEGERNDVSDSYPELVDKFLLKLADYYDEQVKPQQEASDPAALPIDGVWRPWRKRETFVYEKLRKKTVFSNNQARETDLNYFESTVDK
ncbi:Oidioi.mRNA.OKI2018_I69.chr1.g283.t1.cds [Oikopleura dioica]|uniref:Oidioi.mRNA.OKI2018_I69.chr1.g283.t1.cds n=1 Tax=Oikopleura dioica TaxID=34765 RepID=A0ABN7SPF6_OIKDI|nr:Oidioi.mRNA.OKI2018_I69.chr1.g283.t1.cds [Oikopleura dioica]